MSKKSWTRQIFDAQKTLTRAYQAEVKKGFSLDLQEITPNRHDPKLAATGQAFQDMMNHQLCKKYCRSKKIGLYLNTVLDGRLENNPQKTPLTFGTKVIEIPDEILQFLSIKELKAVVGHEIGHVLRQDLHPKRGILHGLHRGKRSETMSDEIAVVLSEEPEALISAIEKINAFQAQQLEAARKWRRLSNPQGEVIEKWITEKLKWIANFLSPYPDFEERKKAILETAERMKDPQEKKKLLEEIDEALSAEHKKLFPAQFKRKMDNTRIPGGIG